METQLIITIVTVVLNVFLGLIVMIRNPKNETNRLLGFYALCMSLYAIVNYYAILPSNPEEWLFRARLTIAVGAFVISPFFLLGYTFPEDKPQIKTIWRILLWLFIGSIAYLSTTPLVFEILEILPDGSPYAVLGPAFPLYALDTLVLPIIVFVLTILKYKKTTGHKRTQMKYFMVAIFLNVLLTDLFGFILPNFFKNTHYLFFAPVVSVFFVSVVFYLITIHKLMDIKVFILRSLSYLLFLGVVSLVYIFGLVSLIKLFSPNFDVSGPIYWILFAVLFVVSISSNSIYKFIEKKLSSFFFKSMYKSEDVVIESFKILASDIEFNNSIMKLFDFIKEKIKITKMGVLILEQYQVTEVKEIGFNIPSVTIRQNTLIQQLENIFHKDGEIKDIFLEESTDEELKKLLRSLDINIIFPLKSKDGEVALFVIGPKASGEMYTYQDYAVLKIIGEQIAQTVTNTIKFKRLQAVEGIKSDFVTAVSHEFKTPLLGSLKTIENLINNRGEGENLSEKDKAQIVDIYFNLKWLNESFEQINLTFEIDTGGIVLNKELININNFLNEDIKKQIDESANLKNVGLYIKITENISDINLDKKYMSQAILTLIDNAIKYSPKDSTVNILIKQIEEVSGKFLVIKIIDSGFGIPKNDLINIFEKFHRGERAQKEIPNGLGLGLFSAKKIIESHNGKIRVDSQENQGSVFTIELPYN